MLWEGKLKVKVIVVNERLAALTEFIRIYKNVS